MAQIGNFTGWNVTDSFVIQPAASKIVNDSNNKHSHTYVWLVPLSTGNAVCLDLNGVAFTVTFAAQDVNKAFPVPVTQVTSSTVTAGNLLGVTPAL